MAKEVKARFKISEGIITIQGKKLWEKEMLERFGKDCDVLVAEFRPAKKKRSLGQNNFWWGITVPEIIDALVDQGYSRYELTPRALTGMLERMFLTMDIPSSEFAGEYITITKEMKSLTTTEWMTFMDNVHRWANEFLGVTLSVPLEQKELDLL